ncbi:MAG: hypothetical protein IJI03_12330 [Rudaea sp.]|nr:hypothetical protein [Rudaea sp.]
MKLIRLAIDNSDGLVKLGPFVAGKLYEVPDDVVPMLDARLAPAKAVTVEGKPPEVPTPLTAEHQAVFAHLRALHTPPPPDKPTAEPEAKAEPDAKPPEPPAKAANPSR